MTARLAVVLLAASALTAHADQVHIGTSAEVLTMIATHYGRAPGFRATYTYEAHDAKAGRATVYAGHLTESRTGQYRIGLAAPADVSDPPSSELVFDGTTLWRLDHAHHRYITLAPKPVLAAALAFFVPGDLAASYTPKVRHAAVEGAETVLQVILVPTPASGRTETLDLELSDHGTVHAVTVTETNGSTYAFHFTAEQLDDPPAADEFTP